MAEDHKDDEGIFPAEEVAVKGMLGDVFPEQAENVEAATVPKGPQAHDLKTPPGGIPLGDGNPGVYTEMLEKLHRFQTIPAEFAKVQPTKPPADTHPTRQLAVIPPKQAPSQEEHVVRALNAVLGKVKKEEQEEQRKSADAEQKRWDDFWGTDSEFSYFSGIKKVFVIAAAILGSLITVRQVQESKSVKNQMVRLGQEVKALALKTEEQNQILRGLRTELKPASEPVASSAVPAPIVAPTNLEMKRTLEKFASKIVSSQLGLYKFSPTRDYPKPSATVVVGEMGQIQSITISHSQLSTPGSKSKAPALKSPKYVGSFVIDCTNHTVQKSLNGNSIVLDGLFDQVFKLCNPLDSPPSKPNGKRPPHIARSGRHPS